MFVDQVKITAKAGSGGNGAVSFHREKFVQNGGPDGGDGGNGGDVVLLADANMHTLMDFRYRRKYAAENGENGSAALCRGKSGKELVIKVPVGTVVRQVSDGRLVADMHEAGRRHVLLRGEKAAGEMRALPRQPARRPILPSPARNASLWSLSWSSNPLRMWGLWAIPTWARAPSFPS